MLSMKPAIALVSMLSISLAQAEGELKFADIGDLKLQSGATLRDCRVGYRTFGSLDAKKDNAVLVPSFFLGTSADMADILKSGGLVDTKKYYVVAVDALADGVSASPSNSKTQGDALFPEISIRDMVESQHQMLIGMGIQHLHAVVGISMGAFQTFQGLVAYPDFLDRAVPISGSTQPTSYDLMLYVANHHALEQAIANKDGRVGLLRAFADSFWLAQSNPPYYNHLLKRDQAVAAMTDFENSVLAMDPYDLATCLSAVAAQDIFEPFGSEAATVARVKAKVFIIVVKQDRTVNPEPALHFAKALKARTLVLDNEAGHFASAVRMDQISTEIAKFLD